MELKLIEIRPSNFSTCFWKKTSEYPENERFLLNLSNIKCYFFSELKALLAKALSKRLQYPKYRYRFII